MPSLAELETDASELAITGVSVSPMFTNYLGSSIFVSLMASVAPRQSNIIAVDLKFIFCFFI